MNLMIVSGMFVCSNFQISVCMFIVLKALLISSATVIVRAGEAIWLNPLLQCYLVLPCVRYYIFVKSRFKHTREECESKRAYVF